MLKLIRFSQNHYRFYGESRSKKYYTWISDLIHLCPFEELHCLEITA